MQNKNQISMPIISKINLLPLQSAPLTWLCIGVMRFSTNITIYAACKSRELSGNLDVWIPEI